RSTVTTVKRARCDTTDTPCPGRGWCPKGRRTDGGMFAPSHARAGRMVAPACLACGARAERPGPDLFSMPARAGGCQDRSGRSVADEEGSPRRATEGHGEESGGGEVGRERIRSDGYA